MSPRGGRMGSDQSLDLMGSHILPRAALWMRCAISSRNSAWLISPSPAALAAALERPPLEKRLAKVLTIKLACTKRVRCEEATPGGIKGSRAGGLPDDAQTNLARMQARARSLCRSAGPSTGRELRERAGDLMNRFRSPRMHAPPLGHSSRGGCDNRKRLEPAVLPRREGGRQTGQLEGVDG